MILCTFHVRLAHLTSASASIPLSSSLRAVSKNAEEMLLGGAVLSLLAIDLLEGALGHGPDARILFLVHDDWVKGGFRG